MNVLKAFDIEILVDVRHYPGSRNNPQFGKAALQRNLLRNKIEYMHIAQLGGRRRHRKESDANAGWRSPQFRGYADYMQTTEFYEGMAQLMLLAEGATVAMMCAEAVPWRCHRSLISDALLVQGFHVIDIFDEKNARPHKMTPFAKVENQKITYPSSLNLG